MAAWLSCSGLDLFKEQCPLHACSCGTWSWARSGSHSSLHCWRGRWDASPTWPAQVLQWAARALHCSSWLSMVVVDWLGWLVWPFCSLVYLLSPIDLAPCAV
jgi:hypothetical protein